MKSMLLILTFTLLSLSAYAEYSQKVKVTIPVGNTREAYATIKIVKVHPHVSIHYFKADKDPSMYLNHAVDAAGIMYYNAILFPQLGLKTYVNEQITNGAFKPYTDLDQNSKEILDLTLQQINNYGGVSEYVKVLENRG